MLHSESKLSEIQSFWVSPSASSLLEFLQQCLDESNGCRSQAILKSKAKLGETYNAEIMSTAIQIVSGRRKLSATGISWAGQGFFLDKQLQQSSNTEIADYHAQRFNSCSCVADICSGLGFDTAALAKVVGEGGEVIAVEADPLVAAFLHLNLQLRSIENCSVVNMSAEEFFASDESARCDGFWIDPDRRSAGNRTRLAEEYSPSLSSITGVSNPGVFGIKVSPVFDPKAVPEAWSVEIIGYGRETKEQVLWREDTDSKLVVSIIDEGLSWTPGKNQEAVDSVRDIESGGYIVEPHNALRQSGRLNQFFIESGITPIAGAPLGYTSEFTKTLGVVLFDIEAVVAFRPKLVNKIIRDLAWDSGTIIKKCGVSDSAEKIRSSLRFIDSDPAAKSVVGNTIFVVGVSGKKKAVFCRRCN